jgi:hypothetical protein
MVADCVRFVYGYEVTKKEICDNIEDIGEEILCYADEEFVEITNPHLENGAKIQRMFPCCGPDEEYIVGIIIKEYYIQQCDENGQRVHRMTENGRYNVDQLSEKKTIIPKNEICGYCYHHNNSDTKGECEHCLRFQKFSTRRLDLLLDGLAKGNFPIYKDKTHRNIYAILNDCISCS